MLVTSQILATNDHRRLWQRQDRPSSLSARLVSALCQSVAPVAGTDTGQSRWKISYAKTLSALSNIQLLILDDWGMQPLSEAHRHDLMEIMDDRYGYRSTAVLSQLPTDQWYNCIGDNTLADAILDRLMHNAHRIVIHGESMRKRNVDLS